MEKTPEHDREGQYCYWLPTCIGYEEQLVFYVSLMAGRLTTSRQLLRVPDCWQALKEYPNATQHQGDKAKAARESKSTELHLFVRFS